MVLTFHVEQLINSILNKMAAQIYCDLKGSFYSAHQVILAFANRNPRYLIDFTECASRFVIRRPSLVYLFESDITMVSYNGGAITIIWPSLRIVMYDNEVYLRIDML
jgi:hypothetical protein